MASETKTLSEKALRRKALRLKLQYEVSAAFAIVVGIVFLLVFALPAFEFDGFFGLLLASLLVVLVGACLLALRWSRGARTCEVELLARGLTGEQVQPVGAIEDSEAASGGSAGVDELALQREVLDCTARERCWLAVAVAWVVLWLLVPLPVPLLDWIQSVLPCGSLPAWLWVWVVLLPLYMTWNNVDEKERCEKQLVKLKEARFLEQLMSDGKSEAEAKQALLELPSGALKDAVRDDVKTLKLLERKRRLAGPRPSDRG